MSNVTIISDGTSNGTRVLVGDAFIKCLTKIVIEPIHVDGTVRATLTVDMAALRIKVADADIEATDSFTAQKIRDALLTLKT